MSLDHLGTTLVNLDTLIDDRKADFRTQGMNAEAMLGLCEDYRRRGCGLLLIDLDMDGLAENLYLSGVAHRELLRAPSRQVLDQYYLTSSFGWPLLDALAVGADQLAAEIAAEMPRDLAKDQREDAEDFGYFQMLMSLASAPSDERLVVKRLAAFEVAVQGCSTTRFDVVNAMVKGDSAGFEDAFGTLFGEWRANMQERRKSGRLDPYEAPTTAKIFVEGLALVRLAKKRGIATLVEYPHIPSLAIASTPTRFPPESAALA